MHFKCKNGLLKISKTEILQTLCDNYCTFSAALNRVNLTLLQILNIHIIKIFIWYNCILSLDILFDFKTFFMLNP